jgi:hypothetical protein
MRLQGGRRRGKTGAPLTTRTRAPSGRLGLLAALTLILLGTPAMVVVALVTGADWAFVGALVTFVVGLFTVGGPTAA